MYFQSKIIVTQSKNLSGSEIAQLTSITVPFNEIIINKEEDSNSIGIEQAKQVIEWNSNKSSTLKLIVIKDSESLTPDAQNSLLKAIEEPNISTQIVLLTNNLNKILSTIKSRCQIIYTKTNLEKENLDKIEGFLNMNFFERESFLSEKILQKNDSRIEFGVFLEKLMENIMNSKLDSNTILCIIKSIIETVKKNNRNVNLKLLINSFNFEIYYYLNK